MSNSRHRAALALAERFYTLAANQPDPNDRLIGERLTGASLFYLGDLPSARRHFERVLAGYVTSHHRHIIELPARPAGDGVRVSCADPVAAGLSGSGDARGRKQR